MKKYQIKNLSNDTGKRLDIYLTEKFGNDLSRSQIKRIIKEGGVLVEGQQKKAHYTLKGDETIEVVLPDKQEPVLAAEEIPLDIIYEDNDILVVNKPSGMVVHPAAGNPEHTLVNALLFHTGGKLSQIGDSRRPGIVHRLDKEVSGLMVVAKTDRAYHMLVNNFKLRTIKRRYIAFVKGEVRRNFGTTDLPIGRSSKDRRKMTVRFFNSKEALTSFRVLKRFEKHTKLALELSTGRTHQIRVHMSHTGHPIIGDKRYGGGSFSRIALYAAELRFKHPCKDNELRFAIDIPKELEILNSNMGDI